MMKYDLRETLENMSQKVEEALDEVSSTLASSGAKKSSLLIQRI